MQVGGADHDSLDGLHLLQKDVLECVQHLGGRAIDVLHSLTEDGISLIEEEDRHFLLALAEVSVDAEDPAYGLLAVTDPLALELSHVNAEDIPSGLLC